MTFRIKYSYKLRDNVRPTAQFSVPEGTVEDFTSRILDIFNNYSGKPEFEFEAKFG